jgi:hypothetical protein
MANPSDTLLLEGATLIDGSGAPAVPDAAVLVEGERIAYAGPRAALGDRAVGRRLDARGMFLTPGLIDLHVHSTFESDMRGYLKNGVTSIRYAGLNQDAVVALRERVDRGDVAGPRIFSCGPMLDASPPAFPHWTLVVETPVEAAEAARRLIADEGVDALIVTQNAGPELLQAIVETAHGLGRPVVGQLWATDGRQAAEIGIDQLDNNARVFASREYPPERLLCYASISERLGLLARGLVAVDWDLSAPILEAMVRRGVVFCPTLVVPQHRAGLGREALEADADFQALYGEAERAEWAAFDRYVAGGWTAADRDFARRALDTRIEWLRRFHAMGGTLVAGTDAQFGGILLHAELRNLEMVGLSRMEVIAAATGRAAAVARLDDRIGMLRPGLLADMLVLRGDPLQDLSALREIAYVVKGGVLV